MAVDVPTLIKWLPNSDEYDADPESADYALLSVCLSAMVTHVGGTCEWTVTVVDVGSQVQSLSESSPDDWPEPVQLATIMFAADLVAAHNRPGVLDIGTYVPKNAQAEKLISRYLIVGFA